MSNEQDKQQPSLELPGVFGRKKKRMKPAAEVAPETATPAAEQAEPAVQPVEPVAPPQAAPPVAEPRTEPVVIGEISDPPAGDAPETAPVEPVQESVVDPAAEPVAAPVARRTAWRRRTAAPAAAEPEAAPEREPVPVGAPPLFAEKPRATRGETAVMAPAEAGASDAPPAPREKRSRTGLPSVSLPAGGGYLAATITGLVIGLLLVGLTFGALRGCETVRGTATCGGAAGLVILVVIMALLIALGGLMLRAFGVPDPTSTSFLAMGMVAVISLLFLLDVLLSPWMLVVLPLITVAMYAAAQWVTTAFVDLD